MYNRNNNRANKQAGVFDYPDDSMRLRDEEIQGEREYNATITGETFDSAPFEIKKNGKAAEFKTQGTGKYNEKFELEED